MNTFRKIIYLGCIIGALVVAITHPVSSIAFTLLGGLMALSDINTTNRHYYHKPEAKE